MCAYSDGIVGECVVVVVFVNDVGCSDSSVYGGTGQWFVRKGINKACQN